MRSPWEGSSRRPIRIAVACVLAADVIALSVALIGARPSALSHPAAPALLLALGGRPWLVAPIAAVALSAVVAFARRPAALAPGLCALGAAAILCESHAALVGGPMRVFFTGGAVMLGWLAGLAFARRLERARTAIEPGDEPGARAEALGEAGAAAALAATYLGASVSKLLASGLSWADANALRVTVVSQRGLGGRSPLDLYASAVLASPALAWTLAALTLLIQTAAVLYPWSPRLRAAVGTLLLAFHLNVWALTPILFPQAMVMLVVLSYPWPRIAARLRPRSPAREVPDGAPSPAGAAPPAQLPAAALARVALRAAALAAAVIALAALSPIRAYTGRHHRPDPGRRDDGRDRGGEAAAPAAPPDVRALLRGVEEGGEVGGFRVLSLGGPHDRAVSIRLARGEVALTVEITLRGARPFHAPSRTARYDLFYRDVTPAPSALPPAELHALLSAIAAVVSATEAAAPPPAGM